MVVAALNVPRAGGARAGAALKSDLSSGAARLAGCPAVASLNPPTPLSRRAAFATSIRLSPLLWPLDLRMAASLSPRGLCADGQVWRHERERQEHGSVITTRSRTRASHYALSMLLRSLAVMATLPMPGDSTCTSFS